MPIYEFKCRDCGAITERLVLSAGEGKTCICRNCGGKKTERIMSVSFLRTASSGFGEPVTAPASGGGCGGGCNEMGGPPAGNWPANDDFIRIKGQQ